MYLRHAGFAASFRQILDVFTMSALILIVGIIVDDAVVVSDKIVALVEEGYPLIRLSHKV